MRLFGLIGYPLSHSFSERFFTQKFEQEDITGCQYKLFPLSTIEEFPLLLERYPDLEGINVTIPYKKKILPYLDSSRIPTGLEACNCINISNGQLTGYNTDITGFELSLKPLLKQQHKTALILGNGGVTAAVSFVLKKIGITYDIVSRKIHDSSTLTYRDIDKGSIDRHKLIINTTPLGMYPAEDSCPDIPYSYVSDQHILFDMVYNPAMSLFLKKGKERGATIKNGEEMLEIQARKAGEYGTVNAYANKMDSNRSHYLHSLSFLFASSGIATIFFLS